VFVTTVVPWHALFASNTFCHPGSVRQEFYWCEALRLVWNMREAPARVLWQAANQPAASQGV
jgi:hypothetical protein